MKNELNKFTVNDHVYKYRALNPMDALDYGSRVAKIVAPALAGGADLSKALSSGLDGKEVSALIKEALGYCYTPESEALDNEAVFNAWFTQHPDELFEAGIKAVYNLVTPFLPKALLTIVDNKK